MPRFFLGAGGFDSEGMTVTLTGDDAHHIARSLRMAVGDLITVCTPDGRAFTCALRQIRDDEVTGQILTELESRSEPIRPVRLFMAYPKGDKLETVIQKAVELGAARITPFESSRCIKRPDAGKIEGRVARWNRIALEAAKQCGRCRVPTVDAPLSFAGMLEAAAAAPLALFCYEADGVPTIRAALTNSPDPAAVSVIVGAEGGFSPEEAVRAIRAGCIPVNLGPRILRCETAPDYALSAISYHFEC